MSGAFRTRAFLSAVFSFGLLSGIANAENVTIPGTASTPSIPGYLARPSGAGPFPAILILHGCEGFGSLESSTADELAGLGYVALAIDALKPQGLTNACGDVAPASRNAATYGGVALMWLSQQPYVIGSRLGVIGYSMGAIAALDLIDPYPGFSVSTPPGLRGIVTYYPACSRRSPDITVPLLILDGSADDWIPPGPCQTLAQAAQAAGKPVQITTYPGATHAFNQPSSRPRHVNGHTLVYDPQATADADAKMRAFFQQHLGGGH